MKKGTKVFICVLVAVVIVGIVWEFFSLQLFGGLNFGFLPSSSYISNPLENVPDLNPINRINPFTDIYKNPFG